MERTKTEIFSNRIRLIVVTLLYVWGSAYFFLGAIHISILLVMMGFIMNYKMKEDDRKGFGKMINNLKGGIIK